MTAVVDASALAEMLVGSTRGAAAQARLVTHGNRHHLPHLAVAETASVLRRWMLSDQITAQRASQALTDLAAFPARRWPADPLLARIWALRSNVSAYDATYVALAESLDAELVTGDGRLKRGVAGLTAITIAVV